MPCAERSDNIAPIAPAVRRRAVPSRRLGDQLVVARPLDGAPVVLAPTAAIIWRVLDDWTTPDGIDLRLAEVFPDISARDRETARTQILIALSDDDLLERA
jgi:hypothetical protein